MTSILLSSLRSSNGLLVREFALHGLAFRLGVLRWVRAPKERRLDLAVPFLNELPSVGLRLFELVGKFYDLEAQGFFFLSHIKIFPDLSLQLLLQAL